MISCDRVGRCDNRRKVATPGALHIDVNALKHRIVVERQIEALTQKNKTGHGEAQLPFRRRRLSA